MDQIESLGSGVTTDDRQLGVKGESGPMLVTPVRGVGGRFQGPGRGQAGQGCWP